MGLPVEINNLMLGSLGGYTVGRSLRFRSSASAYLNRTTWSSPNLQKWTWSCWVKRGSLTSTFTIFGGYDGTSANASRFYFNSSDQLAFDFGGAAANTVSTTAVYRDPSAWYHVVLALDTTQATAANRVLMYVNGVAISSFSSATYPAQNSNGQIWLANSALIGQRAGNYFDGYLAEVNFIDGQALTPSSFGAYDTNGVWQPKKYSGTYGTNGFYLPFSSTTANGFASYYGSFSGSGQYLSIANGGPLAIGTNSFTVEALVYPTNFSAQHYIMGGTGSSLGQFGVTTSGALTLNQSGVGTLGTSTRSLVLNQWQHVAYVRNGTSVKFYINGADAGGSFTSSANLNTPSTTNIGTTNNSTVGSDAFAGYISNVRTNPTTAVYTAAFTPPSSALTAIAGTALLTLQNATIIDNSTNAYSITNTGSVATTSATVGTYWTLANDQSGNGNNWAANNISLTAGTTYDSMIDSPTNAAGTSTGIGNYAVLNPLDNNGYTVTDANLKFGLSSGGLSGNIQCRSTIAASSGKFYWEVTVLTLSGGIGTPQIGVCDPSLSNTTNLTASSSAWMYYGYNGQKYNGTGSAYGSTWGLNDVIGVALDMTSGSITFYVNGTSQGTAFTNLTGTVVPVVKNDNGSNIYTVAINFGQRPFTYTPPSGYKALNTYNLPAAPISNGAQYMAASLYTGNGGTAQTITNTVDSTSFQPDFVWIKSRNSASFSHRLYDSVRGVGKELYSNATNAESTVAQSLTAFASNGFTLGTDTNNNASGTTYVGWQWKAGGTGVTNTSGTITSTVSANTTAGFSVVTFTGTGANATVGHGLGVAPSMIIAKNRSSAGTGWPVYHSNLTSAAYFLELQSTNGQVSAPTVWNSTAPTSSVFSIGTAFSNTSNYVAYCFAAIKGYSAFGTYTGNGSSTDGPFIYTGFRPRWLMIKRTDTTDDWPIEDSSRNLYNVDTQYLLANTSGAEGTVNLRDLLSNGFKVRAVAQNANGGTYVYAAFAENPFSVARAR